MKSLKELHEQRIRITKQYNNKIYSEFWSLKYWRLYMQRMERITYIINLFMPYSKNRHIYSIGDFAPDYAKIILQMKYDDSYIEYDPHYKELFEQEYTRKQF